MASKRNHASDIFAAVFSQKASVCENRVVILKAINEADTGELKFAELLRGVQSSGSPDYNSQRLTYDLQILKKNMLIDQTSEGKYTITKYGSYVLEVYSRIEHELSENELREKPGFVGGVTGVVASDEFDYQLLANELEKVSVFRRTPSIDENKARFEIRDMDADFVSEIEISEDGGFAAQVIIYESLSDIQESFIEDLEKTAEWHRMAEGFANVVYYYIRRSVSKLWKKANVMTVLGPDSYPINIYTGEKET